VALQVHATRQEYQNLVDQYDGPPQPTDPLFMIKRELSSKPFIAIIDEEEANETLRKREGEKESLEHIEPCNVVQNLIDLVKDVNSPYEDVFQAYKQLPSPGVVFLPRKAIGDLFHHISLPPVKNNRAMLRYLSLVDDMKEARLPLTRSQWNSAVHLAGRCFRKVLATEVEHAIRLWKKMEHEAGVRGNSATFNILFDIVVKAGKFVLADMVLAEMKERNLELDRFTRVGLIYAEGAKGNGEGVRAAYRSLVEDGEIVDTVVLSCVIASLVKAGEGSAAELVFERMKRLNARIVKKLNPVSSPNLQSRSLQPRQVRDIGIALKLAAKSLRHSPTLLQMLQDSQLLTPGVVTFAPLISYHTISTGELDRVATLLHEMAHYGIPLNGRIFLMIMRGFSIHGGIRYSIWTQSRLESVWEAFWLAVHTTSSEQGVDKPPSVGTNHDIYLSKWIVIWCLRAYHQCAGTGRMLEVWEQIRSKWEPEPEEMEQVQKHLGYLIRAAPGYSRKWGIHR
jgi:pentatricopeptide repeat protein